MSKYLFLSLMFITVLFCAYLPLSAENISGVAICELESKPTQNLREKQQKSALDSLARALKNVFKENYNASFDATSPVTKCFFDKFIALCGDRIKVTSAIQNKMWKIEYTLADTALASLVASHNKQYQSLVSSYCTIVKEAASRKDPVAAFKAGMSAVYYSYGIIGSSFIDSTISPGMPLATYVRNSMEELLKKFNIDFSEPIITGKPLGKPQNPITVKVMLDTLPFADFPLSGILPDGRKIYATRTNSDGSASLSDFKIPFSIHGTMVHFLPDFVAMLNLPCAMSADALKLENADDFDQTLIFNITKSTVKLNYSVASVNNIDVPAMFTSDNTVKKFLQDSCSLQPALGDNQPDIIISVNCQVSSYAFDEKEETRVKIEVRVAANETKPNGIKIEKTEVVIDKSYAVNQLIPAEKTKKKSQYDNQDQKLPLGLFFWEASAALNKFIKKTLNEM